MSVRCLKIYIKPTKTKNKSFVLKGKCAYFAMATYRNYKPSDNNKNNKNKTNNNRTIYKSQAFYQNEYYASFLAKTYIKCFTEMQQLFKNAENNIYYPNLIEIYIGSKDLYNYLKFDIKPENEKKRKEYKEVHKTFKILLKSIRCRHIQVIYNFVNYDNDKNNKIKDNNITIVYNNAKTILNTSNNYNDSYKVKYLLNSQLKEKDKNKVKHKKTKKKNTNNKISKQ